MAGHSKWKNIQHRKGRQDAARSKLFAKLAREIYVAARQGDPNPANNQRLRLAITKAKAYNMPSANIERSINKAKGSGDGKEYVTVLYEGYGPGGIAVMIDALTDNKNRTTADIRHIFSKNGGSLGEAGCVAWMFERKGVLYSTREELPLPEEAFLLHAAELGAEDLEPLTEGYKLITPPSELEQVKEGLEKLGVVFQLAEITLVPKNSIEVSQENQDLALKLLRTLEEHDDVQSVTTNALF